MTKEQQLGISVLFKSTGLTAGKATHIVKMESREKRNHGITLLSKLGNNSVFNLRGSKQRTFGFKLGQALSITGIGIQELRKCSQHQAANQNST